MEWYGSAHIDLVRMLSSPGVRLGRTIQLAEKSAHGSAHAPDFTMLRGGDL